MATYPSNLLQSSTAMATPSAWSDSPQGFPRYLTGMSTPQMFHRSVTEMESAGEEIAEMIAQACIEDESTEAPSNRVFVTPEASPFAFPVNSTSTLSLHSQLSSSSSMESPLLSCNTSPRSLSYSSSSGSFVESPTSVLRRNGRDSWEVLAAAAGRIQSFDCSLSLASSSPSTSASASPSVSPPRHNPGLRQNTSVQHQLPGQICQSNHQQRRFSKEDRRQNPRGRPQHHRQLRFEEAIPLTGTGVFHPAAAKAQQVHPHQQKGTGAKAPAGSKQKQNNQAQNTPKKAPRPAPPVFIPERLVKALGLNVDAENNIVVNRQVQCGAGNTAVQAKLGPAAQVRAPPVMKLVKDSEVDLTLHKKHGGPKAVRPACQGRKNPAASQNCLQTPQAASGVDELNLPNDWVY